MEEERARELVERYGDLLVRLGYTWLGNLDDAQDVCQTVLLKLLEQLILVVLQMLLGQQALVVPLTQLILAVLQMLLEQQALVLLLKLQQLALE